ncbi:SDR family oxidoreductase [Candidatus Pelagibacter sp.]|nr:SDR family oxidoreductase [Candidatus Pelagibacter sp.]
MVIKKKLNIVIFGATGSIGKYLVNQFYNKGHNLLLYIKDKKKLNILKKKIKNRKLQTVNYEQLDLINNKDLKKKINKNIKFFKKADVIINATGVQGEIGNFFKISLKNFFKTFEINFYTQIILFKTIYGLIKDNKSTHIILFSGGGVTNIRKNFSSYSLSKIALVKLVEILAVEFRNKNIRINAVSPGIIDSRMTRSIIGSNKKDVDFNELNKIKEQIGKSKKTLKKVYDLIIFLNSQKGNKITGKIISSRWDNLTKWNIKKIKKALNSDIFTLRRVEKF